MFKPFLRGLMFLGCVSSACAQQPAAPQTQNIETGDTGWQVICRSTAKDRSKIACSVLQETYSMKERIKIVSFEFVKTDKGEAAVITVPQGVNLKSGIEVTLDGSAKMTFAYSHCLNNQCIATSDISSSQLSAFKKGKQIDVAFSDIQGARVNTQIKLDGFAQAMTKAEH